MLIVFFVFVVSIGEVMGDLFFGFFFGDDFLEDLFGCDKCGKDGVDFGLGVNLLGVFGIGGEFNMVDLG